MSKKIEIFGNCDTRFEAVKDAFRKNFEEGMDVGASFAVMINGEYVVDLWGGYKDKEKTQPWKKDTICCVFSTTKVPTALCTMMCVDRGLLDLDEKVAKYWPEFAQNGKENILVRHILSHTSGLAGIDEPMSWSDFYDWDKMIKLLEAQKPWWEPGTKSGYHAITQAYLLGELVKRVTGKSIGTFLREDITEPLNIDFHIGLQEDQISRVSSMIPAPQSAMVYSLIFSFIFEWANKSELIKKKIENVEKFVEIDFGDQNILRIAISNNNITLKKNEIEKPPDCKFIVAKEKAGVILSLFSTLNEQAEFVSANMKIKGKIEDIKWIKNLFELIAKEVKKADLLLLRQSLNPIDYEGLDKRAKERLWQTSEIPAGNGHGNARAVAKIASIIACEGELDNKRLLSRETVEKILEEQIYDKDLMMQVPVRRALGVSLKGKNSLYPNDRVCFGGGAGGSSMIMDLENKMGIGYVMNQMRDQPLSETLSNKYDLDSRSNRLVTAVLESLGLI
jgi:CubicO group peptidase (beta-lactamase class C family)